MINRLDTTDGPDFRQVDGVVDDADVRSYSNALVREVKSSVKVRIPEERDWSVIRELVRRHHARTVFSHIPFSIAKYEALEKEARTPLQHQCLIVAELRGAIVGMAWFSAGEYVLGDGGVMTTVHLIAVDADKHQGYVAAKVFLRLLAGIRVWSRTRDSSHILVSVTTGTHLSTADRMLRGMGADILGGNYAIPTI